MSTHTKGLKISKANLDPRWWTIRGSKGEAIAYAAHWLDSDPLDELAATLQLLVDRYNSHDSLVEAFERIAKDTILDKQSIEYYKRLHLIHKDWARAALVLAKGK